MLWSSEVDAAITMLDNLIESSGHDVDTLRQAATLLASAGHRKANDEAIRKWDEIAAGVPRGSQLWHEAKLASIKMLRNSGQHEAANQRAKYILLTMPTIDANRKQQYETIVP